MSYPQKRGPWTVLSSKIVYQNPWMSVREDEVTRPDGTPGIYGVMSTGGGVFVLPIDDEGNVYLVKDFQYGVGSVEISTVAGGIDEGSVEDNARRELAEEAGIIAGQLTPLGVVHPYTSIGNGSQYLFLARDLSFVTPHREGTELMMEVLKVPFAQAVEWALDGTITVATSVVCILRARQHISPGNS